MNQENLIFNGAGKLQRENSHTCSTHVNLNDQQEEDFYMPR